MDKLQDLFPWIANLPTGVKLLISVAFVLLAVAALILMWTPQNKTETKEIVSDGLPTPQPQESVKPPTPKPMKTPDFCPPVKTGDNVIDIAQAKLCDLQNDYSKPSETDVINVLKPLFSRPAFYEGQENWEYFLFTLCRTRVLLEGALGYFNSDSFRKNLGDAIQLMVTLQNEVATIYGPTFSITRHIASYPNSREEFTNHLPPVVKDPDDKLLDNRNKTIRQIRAILTSRTYRFLNWYGRRRTNRWTRAAGACFAT
jgi:hypothetical protein